MMKKQSGFAVIELLVVLLIILVVGAGAVYVFGKRLEKYREGVTKGYQSKIRTAVANYYADQHNTYPQSLDDKPGKVGKRLLPPFIPQYLDKIPPVKVTGANPANGEAANDGPGVGPLAASVSVAGPDSPPFAPDGKGWRYNPADGSVRVNSSLLDMNKVPYSSYGYR